MASGHKQPLFNLSNVVVCGHNKLWRSLVAKVRFRIANRDNMVTIIDCVFEEIKMLVFIIMMIMMILLKYIILHWLECLEGYQV